jgi:hypothetical protein
MGVLHIKLSSMAKALHKWSKTLIPQSKVALVICREIIDQLEKAQECRVITPQEQTLIKHLKHIILGLAAICKSRARQKSRLTWPQQGDVNTKYFHMMANSRKKKNFIHSLQSKLGMVVSQTDKHQVIFSHFLQHIGTYAPRSCSLNLSNLGWQPRPMLHLEDGISEDEVKTLILSAPKEKASSPDGVIGLFFSCCWEIIKADLMHAINHFFLSEPSGVAFAQPSLYCSHTKEKMSVENFRIHTYKLHT